VKQPLTWRRVVFFLAFAAFVIGFLVVVWHDGWQAPKDAVAWLMLGLALWTGSALT
jgi:hypothetical protein